MTKLLYPIRLDASILYVPRAMIALHDEQCRANHGRSLQEMERHGGLTPEEAVAVLEDREFARMPLSSARKRLKGLVMEWVRGSLTEPGNPVRDRLLSAADRCRRMRDGHTVPNRALFNLVLLDIETAMEFLPK